MARANRECVCAHKSLPDVNSESEQLERELVDVVCLQVATYIVVMVCRCSLGLRHYSIHRLFLISLDIDTVDGRCHCLPFSQPLLVTLIQIQISSPVITLS